MGEAVRWLLELGDGGEVPCMPGDAEGVLRISHSDTILFTLPAGSLPTLAGAPLLVTRSELGEERQAPLAAGGASHDPAAEWRPPRPGPYEVFVRHASGEGPACRIVVDPGLSINGVPLAPRSIVQVTVLSRCGGPIERWPEALGPQSLLGYNMAHFTPIQPPGDSGSCYSLDDQNSIDPTLMEAPAAGHGARLQAVKASVDRMESELGMLSAMDIVLNHTAGTAPWLLDHPGSAYSVTNSPHLAAAAELDDKLAWYSSELQEGRLGGLEIRNHDDINRVMDGIRGHVFDALRLHEFFTIDSAACAEGFASGAAVSKFERDDYEALKNSALPTVGARRRGVTVPGEAARRCCRDASSLSAGLERLQQDLFEECSRLERDALDALRGLITYERLELKLGPVSAQHPLAPRYFRRLELSSAARGRLGRETETVAHNGWVMDWPATEDFAAPSWRSVYLRRHLNSWGDCVKLRYGSGPSDAPFLWDHMTQYAVSMASIFHAIRLDNAHSTPLHVSQHVLAQVRRQNPNCWIFAELFTGNFCTDLQYQRTLGINALIREAMQCDSPADISNKLTSSIWGARPIGSIPLVPTLDRDFPSERTRSGLMQKRANVSCALIPSRAMPLRPRSCPALLFDCTHDNQTPSEKRHARDALPNAALVAASCASAGTVRGYDELFLHNPSVVTERRPYRLLTGVEPLELGLPGQAQAEHECPASELSISWPHAASKAVARGSWDGWAADLPLQKGADGRWTARLSVPASLLPLQYKFVVDGQWTCDETQATTRDAAGHVNNVLGHVSGAGPDGPEHVAGPDATDNNLPGILSIKQVLNTLHARLGREGFVEIATQHIAGDIVAVQRRAPDTGHTTWFVARSAFARSGLQEQVPGDAAPLEVHGAIARLHVAATLFVRDDLQHREREDALEGLECYLHMYHRLADVASVWREGDKTWLKLTHFPPGSILVFSTDPTPEISIRCELDKLLAAEVLEPLLKDLTLGELSYLLFSCDAEEKDRSGGSRGAYVVPGHGPLVYCGLMGVCAVLDVHRASLPDLLGSPLVDNVREGDWLLGYLTARLDEVPGLAKVQDWLGSAKALIAQLPRQLVPSCFDLTVSTLCMAASQAVLHGSGGFVSEHCASAHLVRDLALATAQFWGPTPSAPLHWERAQREGWLRLPSLAAGLPHFATGFMRNWGRDTFIALRGGLLVPQRFVEARETILVYASVVRHGLCPNLLDAANNPRYNARDATWFFLQAIQDYVSMAPEGTAFLAAPVTLKWKVSDWDRDLAELEPRTLADLVHLILSAHAKGISFREWNAGRGIDEHMHDDGFNVDVRLDEATGILYGGNAWNCGTWMDKNGSSAAAGNLGVPATPRDGAAVEIVGLLKSALRWVSGLDRGLFPHAAVKTRSGAELSYSDWNLRLQDSFENVFWVGPDEKSPAGVGSIYKDTDGATRGWQDYQLRPNFCIAMAVAPELFTPQYARQALAVTAERLIGPLGMCTLDPKDPEYRGDYHNSNESTDKAVAHGWNYHQGPEWVWPLGFFLRAWLRFAGDAPAPQAMRWLLQHRGTLARSPWRSLPELTNSRGTVCDDSCPAQAWSLATLLDALREAECAPGPSG